MFQKPRIRTLFPTKVEDAFAEYIRFRAQLCYGMTSNEIRKETLTYCKWHSSTRILGNQQDGCERAVFKVSSALSRSESL